MWSRPAVSAMRMSAPRATAASSASKTTAAGSASARGRRSRSRSAAAQIPSWSIAAARNVSAAARTTRWPFARSRAASLAMVVVLPVPLTPTTSTIAGAPSAAGTRLPVRGVARREERGSSACDGAPASTSRRFRARSTRPIASVAPTSRGDQGLLDLVPVDIGTAAERPAEPRAEPGARLLQAVLELLALALAAGLVGLLGRVVGAPGPLDDRLGLDAGDHPGQGVRAGTRARRASGGSSAGGSASTASAAVDNRVGGRLGRRRRARRRRPRAGRAAAPSRGGRSATRDLGQPAPPRTASASDRRLAMACASSRRRLMTRLTESSPTVTP